MYIGKAGNLKNRLNSYFSKTVKDPKTTNMLQEASRVDWRESDSEIEALIKEAELIKTHQPKYNVMLRDDKQYSYVVFTDDAFPKIYVTHQPQENEIVFGPFVDGGALRSTLKMFRRIFPFCSCKRPHNQYCLNYHIGQCLGFCCLRNPTVTDEEYQEYKDNVKAIKELLKGGKKSLVKEIEREMKIAGKEGNFERAIKLRDRLEKIKAVFENAKVIREIAKKNDALGQLQELLRLESQPHRIEGYDVANIQGKYATGSMVVFTDGNPDKNEYRKFRIRLGSEPNDTKMLKEILRRRFNHPEWQNPDLIIIDGGKGQLNAARTNTPGGIPVIALTKDSEHKGDHIFVASKKAAMPLKKLPESARHLILHVDAEAHHFAISYYRKLHRRNI